MIWPENSSDIDPLRNADAAAVINTAVTDVVLPRLINAIAALPRTIVLVLEDLQWSDYSTLDLLAMLGRRQEEARLLLIVEDFSEEERLQAARQESEERYPSIYGEGPGEEVGAVSISIDSNDTHSRAESLIGPIRFSPQ